MKDKVYPKLPDLPGVDDAALDSFDTYLTGVIEQARRAVASSRSVRGDDPEGWLRNQREYWRNGVGILTWFRGQIRRMRTLRANKRAKQRGDGAADDGRGGR